MPRRICISVLVFLSAYVLVHALPAALVSRVFCTVPAVFAAVTFGAFRDGTILHLIDGRTVIVAPSCSGIDFFSLCVAFGIYTLWPMLSTSSKFRGDPSRCLLFACCFLFFVYCFTLVVNSLRLVVTVWIGSFDFGSWAGALHCAGGVFVFFPALLFLERAGVLFSRRMAQK